MLSPTITIAEVIVTKIGNGRHVQLLSGCEKSFVYVPQIVLGEYDYVSAVQLLDGAVKTARIRILGNYFDLMTSLL